VRGAGDDTHSTRGARGVMMLFTDRARRILLHGIVWGVLASALEWVTLPVPARAWSDGALILVSIAPGWCVVGVGLAAWIEVAGQRLLRPVFLVASILGCAIVLSAVWSLLFRLLQYLPGQSAMSTLYPNGVPPFGSYFYQAWVIVFYGGLYFFVWTLNYRAERTRQLLSDARVARMRAETLLGESRLAALREYVDPQFLLRAMSEAQRRYAGETASADQLIGHLVAFLRFAMPGVRTGRSSLATELHLTRAYAALCADVGTAKASWSVTSPPSLPDIALPPLLFVLLLESATSAAVDSSIGLDVALENDRVVLRVRAPVRGEWLTADRAYRVRVALSTLYGSNWSFETDAAGDAAAPLLTLSIHVPQYHKETVDA